MGRETDEEGLPVHRFFVEKKDIGHNDVVIRGQDYKHIAYSLRLEAGDRIAVCSPDQQNKFEYIVCLEDFSKNEVSGKIMERRKSKAEPDVEIHLAQALPKDKKMEQVVRRSTEIGLTELIPLQTKRTIKKLKGKKEQIRVKRWQRIAREAAKQARRGLIPRIRSVATLKELMAVSVEYDLILIPATGENNQPIKKVLGSPVAKEIPQKVLIIIGPEGGFSEQEVDTVRQKKNAFSVNLGPRIMRTETAGPVVLALVLYEFGQLRKE